MFHFCMFSDEDQRRLRRINHMTSADTALRILRSQNIWSTDADRMTNFSLNQNPVDQLDEPRGIAQYAIVLQHAQSAIPLLPL